CGSTYSRRWKFPSIEGESLDSPIPAQPQLTIAPLHRIAEQSADPDREAEQVAQWDRPAAARHRPVAQDTRADPDTRCHANGKCRRGDDREPCRPGDQRPQSRVRDHVTVISRGPRYADCARPAQLMVPGLRPVTGP